MHLTKLRQVIAASLLSMMLLAGLWPAPAAAGALPPRTGSTYGMDLLGLGWQWMFARVPATPRLDGPIRLDLIDAGFRQAAEAGVRWNRVSVWWCFVELERGEFFWDDVDAAIQIARNYGIESVPVLMYPPYWAVKDAVRTSDCYKNKRKNYPPQDMADWESFVRTMVRRYGPQGANSVHTWEIWNEPDLPEFLSVDNDWGDGTVPVYADLLARAARVIRAEDPSAVILLGGLSDIHGASFLDKLLRQTGSLDIRNSFDVVSLHAYSQHDLKINRIRDVLALHGLADRSLWNTELNFKGWTYDQAKAGLHDLFGLMTELGIQRSFWFRSTDSEWGPGIFLRRQPQWDPIPFRPSPFYATFKGQAGGFALPAAVTPVRPGGSSAVRQPAFEWTAAAPGSYPLAGYKILIDDDVFMGRTRFASPVVDGWVSVRRLGFVPLVVSGRAAATSAGAGVPAVAPDAALVRFVTSSPLAPGIYYWSVAAMDVRGSVGPYSWPRTLVIRGAHAAFLPAFRQAAH